MRKKIKIAIPTDDGIIVSQKFGYPKGFLVAIVISGQIVRQEMRRNLLSEILTSEHGMYYNLCDCHVVIVNEISNCHIEFLQSKKKEVVRTNETEISKAFCTYLTSILSLVNA